LRAKAFDYFMDEPHVHSKIQSISNVAYIPISWSVLGEPFSVFGVVPTNLNGATSFIPNVVFQNAVSQQHLPKFISQKNKNSNQGQWVSKKVLNKLS